MGDDAPQRFLVLDGLRGVAAIGVVLYHVGRASGIPWLAPRGYLAVDFFFVLSGFVIAHAYGDRLAVGQLSPRAFLAIRFLRLWPTALLGGLIGLAIILLTPVGAEIRATPHFAVIAAANLLLLPNLFPGPAGMYPINPPHWSLFYEIVANFALAIVGPRLTTVRLCVVVAVAAGFSVAATLRAGNGDYPGLSRLGYSFFVGVLVYRSWRGGWRPRAAGIALLGALLLALLIPLPTRSSPAAVDAALSLFAFPAIVWLGATAPVRVRFERLATASGELSYPVYAIHYPIVLVATSGVSAKSTPLATTEILVGLACLAGIGLVVSRVYDRPLRRIARRGFVRSPGGAS